MKNLIIAGVTTGLISVYYWNQYDPDAGIRQKLNMQSGDVSPDLKRVQTTPRSDFRFDLQKYNVYYYDDPALEWNDNEVDTYWSEEAMAVISSDAEKQLLEATYELHGMALEAVNLIVNDDTLLDLFYINRDLWPAIKNSWNNHHTDFQGRFDFAWDGKGKIKMLEYNADTPSLQLESGVLSADWFKTAQKDGHQANYIDKAISKFAITLNEQCQSQAEEQNGDGFTDEVTKLAILINRNDDENLAATQYFADRMKRILGDAEVDLVPVDSIQFQYKVQVDPVTNKKQILNKIGQYDKSYDCVLSLYPKEWMVSEQDPYPMKEYDWSDLKSFEPFWKLLLGNKALLPLLWSMYPNHPLLLPAYYDNPKEQLGSTQFEKLNANWVSKPIFGREGMGVFFSSNFSGNYDEFVKTTEYNFGTRGSTKLGQSVYQAETDLPVAQGRILQTNSWVIGGMPAGLIFREGKQGHHLEDTNPVLLHKVVGSKKDLTFRENFQQRWLRKKIYGQKNYHDSSLYTDGSTIQTIFAQKEMKANRENYKEWISYKERQTIVQEEMAAKKDRELTKEDQYFFRNNHMVRFLGEKQPFTFEKSDNAAFKNFVAYHRQSQHSSGSSEHPTYPIGRDSWGQISKLDNSGRGYWFSVDTQGQVRTHTYYTAGFGSRGGG